MLVNRIAVKSGRCHLCEILVDSVCPGWPDLQGDYAAHDYLGWSMLVMLGMAPPVSVEEFDPGRRQRTRRL